MKKLKKKTNMVDSIEIFKYCECNCTGWNYREDNKFFYRGYIPPESER